MGDHTRTLETITRSTRKSDTQDPYGGITTGNLSNRDNLSPSYTHFPDASAAPSPAGSFTCGFNMAFRQTASSRLQNSSSNANSIYSESPLNDSYSSWYSSASLDDEPIARPLVPGVYIPTVCFFDPVTEDLDTATIAQHAVRLAHAGVEGLTMKDSNGDTASLNQPQTVTAATNSLLRSAGFSHKPIIVGCGAKSVRETIKYCREAYDAGGDHTLVLPPAYYAPLISPSAASVTAIFDEICKGRELLGLLDEEQLRDIYRPELNGLPNRDYWSAHRGIEMLRLIRNVLSRANSVLYKCSLRLGTLLLWLGWLGFNAGSELSALAMNLRETLASISNLSALAGACTRTFLSSGVIKKSRTKGHARQVLFTSMLLWTSPVAATSMGSGTHQSCTSFLDALHLEFAKLTPLFTTPYPPYPRSFPAPTLLLACLLTTTITITLFTLLRSHRFTKHFLVISLFASALIGAIFAVDVPDFVFRYLFFGVNSALIVSTVECGFQRFQGSNQVVRPGNVVVDVEEASGNEKGVVVGEEKKSLMHY